MRTLKLQLKRILQRRHAEQLLHQLFGIGAALAVDGELEAAKIRFHRAYR